MLEEKVDKNEVLPSCDALVAALAQKGAEDPETKALLVAWTKEQEELVEAAGGTFSARMGLELKRRMLYEDAKMMEDANTAHEDLLTIARNELTKEKIYRKFEKDYEEFLDKKAKNVLTDELFSKFLKKIERLNKKQNGVLKRISKKIRAAFGRILGRK